MASVKVNDRELALESNELLRIPLKKNCTTSYRGILLNPGKVILCNNILIFLYIRELLIRLRIVLLFFSSAKVKGL